MLSDLAALTPPLLVCAAFLFAVGAFLRHEMRSDDSPVEDAAAVGSEAGQIPEARDRAPSQATARADSKDGSDAASDD
jgi:hypothetical protein